MKRLTISTLTTLLMLTTGFTQLMNIHMGTTVHQYDLAQVDSITFTEAVEDTLPGFITVPAGTFWMGQSGTNGLPVHQVTLTQGFLLAKNEVTNGQYMEALQWAYDNGHVTATSNTVTAHGVQLLDLDNIDCEIGFASGAFHLIERTHDMGSWGPGHAFPAGYDPGVHPVKDVSWYGAACYCDWISMIAGLAPFYDGNWSVSPTHSPYILILEKNFV